MATFDSLPNEIKAKILETNDPKELIKYCEINSQLKDLCQSDLFWKNLVIKKFGRTNDKGNINCPEKINDNWFNTYKFLHKHYKIYVLSHQGDYHHQILSIHKSFDEAYASLINYLLSRPIMIGGPFDAYFINKYTEFNDEMFELSSKDTLPDNYESFIQKVKLELPDYLESIIEKCDNYFRYTIEYGEYFEISINEIPF